MSHIYDRKKKVAYIAISVFLLLAMVVAVIIGIKTSDTSDDNHETSHSSKKVIQAFCKPTHYKKECEKTLNSAQVKNKNDPRQLAAEAFNLTRAELASVLAKFSSIESLVSNDTRGRYALEICRQLAKLSVRDLERAEKSFERFGKGDFDLFSEDLRVWTGGVLSYQDVCLDSFKNATSNAREKMRVMLVNSRELTANALAIIHEINVAWKDKLAKQNKEGQGKETKTEKGNETENEKGNEEEAETTGNEKETKENETENEKGNEEETEEGNEKETKDETQKGNEEETEKGNEKETKAETEKGNEEENEKKTKPENEKGNEEENEKETKAETKKGNEEETEKGNEKEAKGEKGPEKKEGHRRRRLLSVPMAGEVPNWVEDQKRSIMAMSLADIKADVVVAKDGSGKVKTIRQALHMVPKKSSVAFVIHVKEGIYHEHVAINGRMTSIILVGDGPTKTIISGNKNFADGWPIYMTSTIDIDGEGFMARDIGFENIAGPEKLQAVAARVSADYAVFYNCHFSGFYNTLYAIRNRQFYRECTVSGNVDFISGDAVAVFQNCLILVRAAIPGHNSTVTAQARSDQYGPGAMVLQNCTITCEPGPEPAQSKAFLGRPWKPNSRTIVMQSFIDKVIAPEGWAPFSEHAGLKTVYYGEFMNKGPGSSLPGRVKSDGIKNMTTEEALYFSPGKFFAGDDEWITNTGCPYYGNMLQTTK